MKLALCTTTINVPHVLKLYRAYDADVMFFITGDRKTNDEDVVAMLEVVGNHVYYGYDWQAKLGYACHPLIGENSIQRRNIAFLEALKWGADAIVSIDDDNIPMSPTYFSDMLDGLHHDSGIQAGTKGFFDVGRLLQPNAPHRGIPRNLSGNAIQLFSENDLAVGVNAGICLGDPDIDATTRIAVTPEIHQVSELLRSGVTVHHHTWTVFNSQNTAIKREFVPAWGMIPFVGRMDDIYASMICQRVMRERDRCVHFGQPFVWQQRNDHNLVKDLRGEIDGYENVARLTDVLDHIQLVGKNVIDDCRRIWDTLAHVDYIPAKSVEAMQAYVDDCSKVM